VAIGHLPLLIQPAHRVLVWRMSWMHDQDRIGLEGQIKGARYFVLDAASALMPTFSLRIGCLFRIR
jgi:hypothetical protein